ncbi:hypothetical protein E1956_30180 [Paraburkholderia pallida]|uniref:Uncharacterized protein n=1 Tax=Paraburkholderia pallida TaxID=2547399 RepID=A0A4P7D0W8_9BURK|nr:hypothetical protein E1956_30180 [Paraburkholderia pallida]
MTGNRDAPPRLSQKCPTQHSPRHTGRVAARARFAARVAGLRRLPERHAHGPARPERHRRAEQHRAGRAEHEERRRNDPMDAPRHGRSRRSQRHPHAGGHFDQAPQSLPVRRRHRAYRESDGHAASAILPKCENDLGAARREVRQHARIFVPLAVPAPANP